ncbi:cation diffusion facilitator family transporter [Pseudalkalibacillus salsuginis]|uniref:cation diffusion facilitator family transporter n=1 Tax=Pseudalkalibacillus salsuginis TaxID=2910972 RepID=UPI001F428EF7|nr:cation diffusion facilitator family transporter [Pseudalkalibacillus salsuginis]MCF6408631.1 cation diffusion facilitator family transporter [Pseudalkalibacillus salsuginis]
MDNQNKERFRQGEFAAWVGIVGNLILAVIKGVVGYISNSRALMADAVHSASDVGGSFAVLLGLRAAKLPPDRDHPYGHGKAESIAAIIVAVLLFIVGLEIGYSSVESFFHPIEAPRIWAIYAVIFSIISKELMFQYKYRLGKRINSDAIITNAYEHRSDVFSSIAALIGIGAAVLGGKLGVNWLEYADPIAGLAVSLLVLRIAWKLGAESIHNTLDHVLHDEDTVEMRKIVESVEGVMNLDEFFAREHGYYVIIDIKIAVDPEISVQQGHDIGKEVKRRLIEQSLVRDVFVHINPYQEEKDGD